MYDYWYSRGNRIQILLSSDCSSLYSRCYKNTKNIKSARHSSEHSNIDNLIARLSTVFVIISVLSKGYIWQAGALMI